MDQTPTHIDPGFLAQDIAWVAFVVVIIVESLAAICVGLRFYTRKVMLKQLGPDDYCMLLTLALAISAGAAVLAAVPDGLGKHAEAVDPKLITSYLWITWTFILLYNVTLMLTKMTFLLQYYRVLAVHKMRRVVWVVGVVILLWSSLQIFLVIFACSPIERFWDRSLPGTCILAMPFWYINAAGNIATNLAIFCMPLPVLGKLRLPPKQKYLLIGIFSLGFFTCLISLIRLAYLKQYADFTWANLPTTCWSVGELACGIICACLPTLRPLVSKLRPSWMHNRTTRRSARRNGEEIKGQLSEGALGNSVAITCKASKNYSRISHSIDTEMGGAPPPPSPTLKRGRSDAGSLDDAGSVFVATAGWDDGDDDEVPMQQLHPRPRQMFHPRNYDYSQSRNLTSPGRGGTVQNSQNQNQNQNHHHCQRHRSLVGMPASAQRGFTTQVVAGAPKPPSIRGSSDRPRGGARSKSGNSLSGIEVKRDVVVSTMPSSTPMSLRRADVISESFGS